MIMKKVLKMLILVLSIINCGIILWLITDLNSIGTSNFDVIKWLDADIWIINNIFLPSIIILLILLIVEFVWYIKSETKTPK